MGDAEDLHCVLIDSVDDDILPYREAAHTAAENSGSRLRPT
jgi:hypothetical protein